MAEPKKSVQNGDPSLPKAPDFADHEKEEVGLAPFWKPKLPSENGGVEDFIYVIPLAKDLGSEALGLEKKSRGDFTRYIVQNLMPQQQCRRGSGRGGQELVIDYGDVFSISPYSQLEEMFDDALACGFPVPIRVIVKDKVEGGKGDVWIFETTIPKKQREPFHKFRVGAQADRRKNLLAAMEEKKALAEKNA